MNIMIARKSAIFCGMAFLQKGVAFFLIPIYTHFLSPGEYGVVNLVNSITAIYILITSLALDDAMTRYYFQSRKDQIVANKTISTIAITSLLLSIIAFVTLLFGNAFFIVPFINNINFFPYAFFSLMPVLFASMYELMQKILIIDEQAFKYSINAFSFFLINTLLCIIFIIVLELKALGVLLASSITYFVFFCYSMFFLFSKISFSIDFNKEIFKESIKYGLILLPNRIAAWGMGGVNRLFIGNALTIFALGVFSVANTFSTVMVIFANSVSMAIQPWVFKKLEMGEDGKRQVIEKSYAMAALFCIIGLGLSLFSKEVIIVLIDKRYFEMLPLLPILYIGTTASAYSVLFVHILFYYQKFTKYIAYSTIIAATVNILTCIVLLPIFGEVGVCIAMSISQVLSCIIIINYALIACQQRFDWIEMIIFFGISAFISLVCTYWDVALLNKIIIYTFFIGVYFVNVNKKVSHFIMWPR